MNTLFDLLSNAQNGQAIDNMARQFALSQQQALAATQALLPAFSLGLKRQVESARTASSPPDFFGLGGMPQVDAFQNAAQAFTQQAMQQGQQIMASLFGSPEMTRALSQLAAEQSRVAAPIISAMMPAMASILVSGLAHAAAPKGSGNPMGDMMASMMKAWQPAPSTPQFDLAAMWAPFLGAMAPQPKKAEPADMFGQILEAGSQMQKAQTEAMQSLFETWWGKK
jgi:hypothetical protein